MSLVAKIASDTDLQKLTEDIYGVTGVSDVLWG